MKITKLSLMLALSIFVTACATGRSPVSPGVIFTAVDGSESISSNPVGSKRGSACATNVLGLFAFGDASIAKAATSAKIEKFSHVDYSTTSFLGLFAHSCTNVYGE